MGAPMAQRTTVMLKDPRKARQHAQSTLCEVHGQTQKDTRAGMAYRSNGCGDAGLVHGANPWVMRGFDNRHSLLFL